MDKENFIKLIDKNKYQVFLFSSPIPIPLNFAVHTWFVINLKGRIHRWEFGRFRDSYHENNIGVVKDLFQPREGMYSYFWKTKIKFNSKLIKFVEGGNNSIAKKLALYIEKESINYPLRKIYSLKGPNSNSYMQWILNQVPNSNLKLPVNAFGKGFKFK